jgi:prophage regulatory protein
MEKPETKQMENEQKKERIIRKSEMLARTGLSDATIWRLERQGTFPKRLRLGGNSCGWLESELDDWFRLKAEAR